MPRLIIIIWMISCLVVGGAGVYAQGDPTPLTYGDTVQGEITTAVLVERYTFTAQAGDAIVVLVTSDGGTLDPYVTLSNSAGTLLASDDNSGGGTTALLSTTLETADSYILSVSRSPVATAETFGTYTLALTTEAGNIIPPASDVPPITSTDPISAPNLTNQETTSRLQNIQIDSTISGSFTATNNVNIYWFEGVANQQISVQPAFTSELTPMMVLYRSDLSEIVRSQEGAPLTATLTANDIYFLAAASTDTNSAGRYEFQFTDLTPEVEPTLAEDVLVYGQSRNNSITNTTPTQRFRLSGEAGDTVTISMTRLDGDLDSYLILADSSGATLAEDDNSGGANGDARISFTLPTSGEFFVIATRVSQERGLTTGGFTLSVESDAPPRIPTDGSAQLPADYVGLPQIAYGETVTGSVTNEAFLNIWVFYGEAGDSITVRMESTDGTLDPLLILLDAQRIPLIENDDIVDGQVRDSQIENYVLSADGYYAIVATRFEQAEGTSSGGYSLSLATGDITVVDPSVPFAERWNPLPLTAGETPSGSFEPLKLGTVYTFPAAEGSLVDFSVTADNNTPTTLILLDSTMQVVSVSDSNVLLAITAPATDDYYVLVLPQVGPAINVEGDYFVALNIEVDGGGGSTVSSGTAIPIAYGNTVVGELTEAVGEQRYTFQGTNGDVVEITMSANSTPAVDTLLQVLDAEGTVLAENDDIEAGVIRDSRIIITLPADGTYTIVATRYEGTDAPLTFGDYILNITTQDPTLVGVDQAATDIVYGETVAGEIDATTYLRFYYFVGTQGDRIAIQVDTTSGNLDALMYLYTFTSANEPFLLVANDDSPLGGTYDPYIEYTLPRSGPYLIGITRFAGTDAEITTGTFNLTVTLLDTPDAATEDEAPSE